MAAPNYISWTGNGSSCGEPPGVFTGATMHMFGVAANMQATQALANQFLNPVAGRNLKYTAYLDLALVTILDVEQCTTSTENIGWLPGREVALWIPLMETRSFLSIPYAVRPVMWSPYIFINYSIGMVTGREVWGWSKAIATIDFPSTGSATPKFSVTTTIFDKFDATKPGRDGVLLTVSGNGPLSTTSTWTTLSAASTDVSAQVNLSSANTAGSPFFLTPEFPAIALKQFRDSNAPDLACFQAIINSPVHIKNFDGGGWHTATFQLEVTTCDSHPIVKNFFGAATTGASTVLPVSWAAWAQFDFDANPGTVIARTI